MNAIIKPRLLESDIETAIKVFSSMPTDPPLSSICEFTETTRIMPPGTPFPGLVDLRLSPWAREWMENMSPYSLCQIQAILKASQTSATFAATNVIGYWMKEIATAILYASATNDLLEKWATKRLEAMIDSCGIRELIIENAKNVFRKSSRRTGDRTLQKLFIGGFLEMASLSAPSSLRSDSFRVGIIDETDGVKKMTSTGEGKAVDLLIESRFKQWGARKKIMIMSTPTTEEESVIGPYFDDGDQRYFMIPCPMCGKKQALHPFPDQDNYGLQADTKAGKIQRVYYLCEFCHDAFFETSKHKFTNSGKWVPTATSSEPEIFKTYSINSLYAPAETVNWKQYYQKYQAAKEDPEKMRTFTNLYAGLRYREEGERPKLEKIIKLRGGYKSGTIQPGVLFLTIGADVQEGKKDYRKFTDIEIKEYLESGGDVGNLPRIELEVLGIGAGYRTWSIEYKVFPGRIDNAYSGAFEKVFNWLVVPEQRSYIRADGIVFVPEIMLIDSGDGNFSGTVYSFTQRFPRGVYPSKGYRAITRRKNEAKGKAGADHDELTDFNFLRYRRSELTDITLYTISTNYYKSNVYHALNIPRIDSKVQRPGFCDFPRDYPDKYFNMLRAEEQLKGGAFSSGNRPNEGLDCRVYALCGADAFLDGLVFAYREQAKKERIKKSEIEKIDKVWVLNNYKKMTGNEDYYKND